MKKLKSAFRILRRFRDYLFAPGRAGRVWKGWFPLLVEYPVRSEPRYGYGKPPHAGLAEILDRNRESYAAELHRIAESAGSLDAIAADVPALGHAPWWNNPWFTGLDAAALYGFLVRRKPDLFLEIGSGMSTRFAKRAIDDHDLDTKIVSIDPEPRLDIDSLCDTVIRERLEDTDLDVIDRLSAGDILFFDGSHLCFTNSDVAVFFLEVLPRVPEGTLIHLHDIYLPVDYPPERKDHHESEQYLLATLLLAESPLYRVLLPNRYICADDGLKNLAGPYGGRPTLQGTSFWMEKTRAGRSAD